MSDDLSAPKLPEERPPAEVQARAGEGLRTRIARRSSAVVRSIARWLDICADAMHASPVGTRPQAVAGSSARAGFFRLLYRRLLIWFTAAAAAFYLPLHNVLWQPHDKWTALIQDSGKLPDMFMAVVAMLVLSASDIVDNIIAAEDGRADAISVGSGWALIVAYFCFILYGLPVYTLAYTLATPPPAAAWDVLGVLLMLSLFSEFIIAAGTISATG